MGEKSNTKGMKKTFETIRDPGVNEWPFQKQRGPSFVQLLFPCSGRMQEGFESAMLDG